MLLTNITKQIIEIELHEESENEIYFNVCLLKVAACVFEFFQDKKKNNTSLFTKNIHAICKTIFKLVAVQL